MESQVASRLRAAWDREFTSLPGTFSVEFRSLGGPVVSLNAGAVHYAASTIKLAVLGALLQDWQVGGTGFGTAVVQPRFTSAVGGTFEIVQSDDQDDETWGQLGRELDLIALAERMIVASGNLATNLILERIGVARVRDFLTRAGLDELVRLRRLIGDAAAEARGVTNTVTAGGLASLMIGFARATVLSADASAIAIAMLARQTHLRMIPAGLPAGTWCASKGGWVPGVRHDVAMIRPDSAPAYVLAVCTTSELDAASGEELVARISAITWEHWTR